MKDLKERVLDLEFKNAALNTRWTQLAGLVL